MEFYPSFYLHYSLHPHLVFSSFSKGIDRSFEQVYGVESADMRVKRKKLDIVFSQLVRERANYVCQACCAPKRFEQSTLDCAHIMSRRNLGLRFHPRNAVALCRGCHIFYTEHPFDWSDWCKDQFGDDFISELRLVANQTVKWTKKQREEIYQFYREEFKRMEEARRFTELMIEFPAHELMHVFEQDGPRT